MSPLLAVLPETLLTPAEDVEVSVVMPCLDEARTVGVCVRKAVLALERLGVSGEVIVADNGSRDGSPDVARQAGALVIAVADKGYGHALRRGIAAARGRFVVMGDADDSYDFAAIGPFIERLRAGDELVMGNRFRGGIRPGAMPWLHRYVGKRRAMTQRQFAFSRLRDEGISAWYDEPRTARTCRLHPGNPCSASPCQTINPISPVLPRSLIPRGCRRRQ
jgi:glycosyltransferase involved in cell wall biosynthesis